MFSLAFGVATKNSHGDWLEVYYPRPLINPDQAFVSMISSVLGYSQGNRVIEVNDEMTVKLSEIAEMEYLAVLRESVLSLIHI